MRILLVLPLGRTRARRAALLTGDIRRQVSRILDVAVNCSKRLSVTRAKGGAA